MRGRQGGLGGLREVKGHERARGSGVGGGGGVRRG